jgi:hypothetical protein
MPQSSSNRGTSTSRSSSPTPLASGSTLRVLPWRQTVTPWEDIVSHRYDGSGTIEDPYIVTWLPHGDAEDPFAFDDKRKWTATAVAGICTMAVGIGSSIFSAVVFDLRNDLHGTETQYILREFEASLICLTALPNQFNSISSHYCPYLKYDRHD